MRKRKKKNPWSWSTISTCGVETPPAGPARHLNVLCGQQRPELLAIVLANAVKDDGAGGHVDAHGKGLRGEEQLDPAVGEAALHHLLEDGQDA